ncbi:putative porin [Microbulbifer aggregans]|uniref:putative porin n=1 Tax=Microbulbifer aggregans TaxID=1769779 RepID=UPI001CFCB313|nr:putative porin [Microbulbifer aggregans]
MQRRALFGRLALTAAFTLLTIPAIADEKKPAGAGEWDYTADFRLRLEQDWDSREGDGSARDPRLRMRIRLRGGLGYHLTDHWKAQVRLRSGPRASQQSTHITIYDFNGGDDGPYEFNFDQWFLGYKNGGTEFWAGRRELEYLHQDELFVFDNITYTGIGGGHRDTVGDQSEYFASFNYVKLPVGMRDYSGRAAIGELAYRHKIGSGDMGVALGFFLTNADSGDPDNSKLLTENGSRDYREINLQLQYRTEIDATPLTLGADFTRNFADYDDADPGSFTDFHRKDVNGFVVEAMYGNKKKPCDWQIGYFYSYQETLATNSSYTQDEWVRWGMSDQVRATNYKGHELRFTFIPAKKMSIVARLFLVDAIDLLYPDDVAKEDGKRLRVDWNISF